MNASTIRRFLQAPDELRFPIAAPAILGLMWLGIFVLFGFLIGINQVDGMNRSSFVLQQAFHATHVARMQADGEPANIALWSAHTLDAAVSQWNRDEKESRSSLWMKWTGRIPLVARLREDKRKAFARVAEDRLKYFSGNAPTWMATASLCEERLRRMGGKSFSIDYIAEYTRTAENYSRLLGRELKPVDLAPRVPKGRCD